jgi:carboxypeptidase family protein
MWSVLVTLAVALLAVDGQTAVSSGAGVVTGRIVDAATGEPIPGATVSLSPTSGGRSTSPSVPVALLRLLTNQTNVAGIFEIVNVPSGRWSVQVSKEGYIPLGPSSSLAVEVGGGTARIRDVQIDRGGAIVGRVLDARGGPITRVMVLAMQQLRNRDGSVRLTGGASGQTNDLGEFRVSGLGPGLYVVLAQPPPSFVNPFTGGSPTAAPASSVRTFYPGALDVAQASPVAVSRGLTTRGIEFSMLSVPSYQVFGVVVDNSGRPVGGAAVRLVQARPPLPATVYQGSPSALDGTFVIVNVPEGRYSAQAAIPLVTRNSNGGISASIRGERAGGPGSVEVVVRGANVEGLRLVATPP